MNKPRIAAPVAVLCLTFSHAFSTQALDNQVGAALTLDAKAMADYDRALELDPENDSALFHRGLALVDRGLLLKAVNDFSSSIRLPNYRPQAYLYRGEAYFRLHKYDQAIADYNQSERLSHTDFSRDFVIRARAKLYSQIAKSDRVILETTRFLSRHRQDAQMFLLRGEVYYRLKQYDQAVHDYSQSLRLDETNVAARQKLALAYDALGKHDLANAERLKTQSEGRAWYRDLIDK